MSYATLQDLVDRYGLPRITQLTDVNEPLTGAPVATVANTRLADASAEIDGYLAGRMSVPLASPPAIIKVLACRIGYYLLLGNSATEVDLADVKAARAYLQSVGTGAIALAPPDQVPVQSGEGAVLFSTGAKDWGREAC